ncbi:MAG: hypothetical protein KF892_03585 [Rhizobacter sp.]|nr:hypothetical protein [Rhizobacter sp.]
MDHPVDRALHAQLPPSALTEVEQEDYLDRLEELQLLPSQAEIEFFASRRLRGVGVGLDDEGNLVHQQRGGGTVPTANSKR